MINLRKMAEDEVVFRFESDEDRKEFWELYVKNDGNRNVCMLGRWNYVNLWIFEKYNKITFNFNNDETHLQTWTEIKEKYRMKSIKDLTFNVNIDTKEIKQAVDDCIETIKQSQVQQAITLLQSQGYKVEEPYKEPTDEDIIERIKFENKKIGYDADWHNEDEERFYIAYDKFNKYEHGRSNYYKGLGITYTTQEIATKIVTELNEKRFERV